MPPLSHHSSHTPAVGAGLLQHNTTRVLTQKMAAHSQARWQKLPAMNDAATKRTTAQSALIGPRPQAAA